MQYNEIEQAYENLIDFSMRDKYQAMIKEAQPVFVLSEDQSDIEGFAEWFIFNYKTEGQPTIVSEYHQIMKTAISKAFTESTRSIFSVKKENQALVLTDILTNDNYLIKHDFYTDKGLLSLRLVTVEDQTFIVSDIYEFDPAHEGVIRKYLFEQYNDYCKSNGAVTIEDFIRDQNHLILKVSNIITELYQSDESEDEFLLYQTSYAFNCSEEDIIERLLTLENYVLFADEEEDHIYRLLKSEELLAEIEVKNQLLYVLTTSQALSHQLIHVFEALIDDDFAFIKTEILTINEIL